jgi:hypothetical protein
MTSTTAARITFADPDDQILANLARFGQRTLNFQAAYSANRAAGTLEKFQFLYDVHHLVHRS